jgi:type 1 glutamine amidotransferase
MRKIKFYAILAMLVFASACKEDKNTKTESPKLKVLIVDGQNNHYVWPKTTQIMRSYLEQTDLFEVDIYRTDSIWLGFKYDKTRPGTLEKYITEYPIDSANHFISAEPVNTTDVHVDFNKYDLVVSNFGERVGNLPESTKRNLENYMKNGGGLVVVHAANNAWGDWPEFNKMIGLGAWGGRDSITGSYAYYDNNDELQVDPSPGTCGSHGAQYEYIVTSREPQHPIMKGLPLKWLHTQDEMYERMRGPFENATILATAFGDVEKNAQTWEPELKGTGWNVPTLMVINYGKGRIFHTTLGHFDYSMECVGFMTTLQRGAEWAATGKVTQAIPEDFPSGDKSSSRIWKETASNK